MAGSASAGESDGTAASEDEAKTVFARLRPKCVQVMQNPSLSSLGAMDEELRSLSSIPPQMVDYVVLPLRVLIKRTGRYVIHLHAYDCARMVRCQLYLCNKVIISVWKLQAAIALPCVQSGERLYYSCTNAALLYKLV